MYNPQELQRKAQLNLHGVDIKAQTSLNNNNAPKQEKEDKKYIFGATTLNFFNNVAKGAVKTLEGIVDAGIMIGGLFGADVEDAVSYDFTSDLFGTDDEDEGFFDTQWGNQLEDASYLDNDHIVNQIADGVGGMLPSIALNFIPGVGTALSTASFIGSASGNASESAFNEGATYGQALGYGALSGAIEAGTEMIGGRVFGSATNLNKTLLGKLALKTGADKVVSKGLGKAVYSFASEGFEEVVADVLDPLNKRLTGVDKEATIDWKQLPKTFFIGGAVGAVLDGMQNGASAIVHKKEGGKHYVNVANEIESFINNSAALEVAQQNGKISQDKLNKISSKTAESQIRSLKNMSKSLQEMTEEQRKECFKTLNEKTPIFNAMFEEDGKLKKDALDVLDEVEINGLTENMSTSLLLNKELISNDVIKTAEHLDVQMQISDTNFIGEDRKNLAKIYRATKMIGKKAGKSMHVVVVKGDKNIPNGYISKNGIMYIDERRIKDGTWAKTTAHEVTHFIENSPEYKAFAKFLLEDTNAISSAKSKILNAEYKISSEEIDTALNKVKNSEKLSDRDNYVYTEVIAHITEDLLGNKETINRLVRSDEGLARKILNRIIDFINAFKGTNANKDTILNLEKAKTLFENALSRLGKDRKAFFEKADKTKEEYLKDKKKYLSLSEAERVNWLKEKGYITEDFNDEVLDNGEEFDNSGEMRYSFKGKKTARYINKKLDTPTLSFIRNELRKIYGPIYSAIADGIAIEKENSIFVVDSGIEDGIIDFGVRQQIKIDDDKLRKERLEKINDRAVSNGFSSSEISGRIKCSPDNSGRSSVQRKLQKELSDNTGKPENKERRISEKDATNGSRRLKFSLKDSDGNLLSPAQQNFFKDSKAIDEKGNLRVVYHGTVGEFYTFDKTYLGSATGVSDAKLGFFFTSDKNVALEYAINAHDTKFYNLAHKIADGDNDKFNKLLEVDGYKEFAMTEDVQELGVLKEKGENFEHDVYEVYLNIKNPLIDDWQGLTYRKAKMLKLVTRAIQENYDGVIIKNIDDSYDHDGQISDVYFIFEPNQVKFTTNKNPTEVDDMRFSYKTNSYEFVENKANKENDYTLVNGDQNPLTNSTKPTYFYRENNPNNFNPKAQTLREQLYDAYTTSDSFDQRYVYVGRFADSFINLLKNNDIIVNDYPIAMNFRDAYLSMHTKETGKYQGENINYHNLGVDGLELALNSFVSPINILKSKKENKIELVLESVDKKGNSILSIVAINQKTLNNKQFLDAHIVTSVYGKRNIDRYINKAEEEGRIIKIKKEESSQGIPQVQYKGNINDNSSINSILNTEEKVNINSENSLDTIRYSKKSSTLSDGQVKKKLANLTKLKVYSKTETEQIVNSLIDSNLGLDNVLINVSGKTKAEVIDVLWKTLNTADAGKRTGISLKIADYIIENSVAENLFGVEENEYYINTLAMLKPYFHNLDLTEVKSSIKARGENNSVYALWSNKEGISPYTMKEELSEEGFILEGETDAEVFFDMLDKYRNARDYLNKEKTKLLKSVINEEEIYNLRQNIAKDILRSFDSNGQKSKLADIIDKQKQTAKVWKDLYREEKQITDAEGHLKYQIEKFKDVQTGKYLKASDYKQKLLEKSIGQLKKLVYTGKFNDKRARLIMGNLKEWYTKENPLFANDKNYNEDVARWMSEISENIPTLGETGMEILERFEKQSGLTNIDEIYKWYTKANVGESYSYDVKMWLNKIVLPEKYTANELYKIAKVVGFFRNYLEKFRKIYVSKGVYEDAMPKAKSFVDIQIANNNEKMNGAQRMFNAIFQTKNTSYAEMFVDPMSVARYYDRYNLNGFNQYGISQLQNAELEMQIDYMNIMRERDKFFADTKYAKRLKKTKVVYQGKEIPLDSAVEIYMLLKDDDALLGFAHEGLKVIDAKGNFISKIQGFANEKDTIEEIRQKAKETQIELEQQFTKDDLQYISIQEYIYNVECRNRKEERDNERQGYSNVKKGYYHPIWRADAYKGLASDYTLEMGSVNSASFNKNRIESKARLLIMPASVVFERHIQGVLKYYHYSPIEANLNTIRSLNIAEDGQNPLSLEMVMSESWKNFDKWYNQLYKDIKGVKEGTQFNLFSAIRGNTAKASLGFNPKVCLTQFSSFPAAAHILDIDALIKGLGIKSSVEDLYKYAPISEARQYNDVSAKSQGVIENASEWFLKGIGWVDSLVVKGLWGSCQYQIEKDKNFKIGTEENKKEAGELLKKVIIETQQNIFKSSQTQASRSNNDLLKMLVMFRGDTIKGVGRFIDSIGTVLYAKNVAERRSAYKQLVKSSGVIIFQSLYIASLSLAFAKLYNIDDEDENSFFNFISDALGNLLGGFPIIGSFIDSITSGYDVEDMSLGTINDTIDSIRGVGELFDSDTDSREIATTSRKVIYSISSFLGLPVKNLYKIIYGGTNIASPSTAYQMDNWFYKQSYKKDLIKAIENDDENMISTIAGLIMNENVGAFENKATRNEVDRLITAGYDVLPQSIGSSMTIDGETFKLTESQKQEFKKTYNQSIEKVDALVSSNGYKIASDEAKAKAIKYVYKYYFYEAQQDMFDLELDNKLYLFGQIVPIEKMALALAEAPIIAEKSTNKKTAVQRYLQASKLTATQKYMLMGYFGYKNTKGERIVANAINKTSLTKEQRSTLLGMCGY